jgi:hypothetical protein
LHASLLEADGWDETPPYSTLDARGVGGVSARFLGGALSKFAPELPLSEPT